MHTPEPALVMWIIGAPLVFAVVDLLRTLVSLKNTPSSEPGIYSRTLGLHRGSAPSSTR